MSPATDRQPATDWASWAAVTIDLDGAHCYRAIHGLAARPDDEDFVYARALPRFLEACDRIGVRATLFCIGDDVARPELRPLLEAAHRGGHELASHSHAHDYGLSRRPREVIDEDLRRSRQAIADVIGEDPVGFRAPGYNLSEALTDAVEGAGFVYDSSLFPTPLYFAARAAALLRYRVEGRSSHSLVGDVREFSALRTPFRPSRRARFRPPRAGEEARRLVEIPMSVSTPFRLPWLGTTLALFPDAAGQALTAAVIRSSGPAVLELHAIDFAGPDDGAEAAFAAAQPDLRVALDDKLRRLERALTTLASRRRVVPLRELASFV